MSRMGRPKAELVLSDDEREQLLRWARRRKSSQALALRCRIVLECATGAANTVVADRLGVSEPTVGKWRSRFVEHRLDGLCDDARPGRPATVSAEQVEDVIVATLESTPANATHWSRAKMAERTGLSKSSIGRIWKAFELKPHRTEGFKLSNDPLFVEKVYDIVGLYLDPPENAVVLSVDEKSQVQALARSQPAFPMMPGMPEKRTHDYVRHGTTSLFAALNVADGTVISSTHRRHRATEFKKFLTKIEAHVPAHLDVHVICDNYGTHKHPNIKKWLQSHPRFSKFTAPASFAVTAAATCCPSSPGVRPPLALPRFLRVMSGRTTLTVLSPSKAALACALAWRMVSSSTMSLVPPFFLFSAEPR